MAEFINRTDNLNQGREKLNDSIRNSNKALSDSGQALNTANEAKQESENTQEQLDQIVIEGDSSVEAAQARVKADGTTFDTLRERLNSSDQELAQKADDNVVRKKTQYINLNDLDEDALKAIEGGEGTSFNLESIPRDYSVSEKKTTFMKRTKNLFDREYHNLRLENFSGEGMKYWEPDSNDNKTAVIPISPNETYTVKIHVPSSQHIIRAAVVNTEVDFDVGTTPENTDRSIVTYSSQIDTFTFTNDENGKYLLVQPSQNGEEPIMQAEVGDTATEYEPPFVIGENIIDRNILRKVDEWRKIQEVVYVENLFKKYIEGTYSESSGNYIPNETTVVSDDFLPVIGDKVTVGLRSIQDGETLAKIGFYNDDNYISSTGFFDAKQIRVITLPAGTTRIKAAVRKEQKDAFYVNIGETPYFETNQVFKSGFGDLIPRGVVEQRHLNQSVQRKLDSVDFGSQQKPYPSTFRFETILENVPIRLSHLSKDGKVVYGMRITRVVQSLDDGDKGEDSWQEIIESPNGQMVLAVRELDDGELLFTTQRNESQGIKAKIYKTRGYDRHNLENVTAVEVLEAKGVRANFQDQWCLEAHDNIVVANEYGLHGDNGARYAYLSTDYGNPGTWIEIFDQKLTTPNIEGAPTYTQQSHLHTIHYDRYWNRIWLAVGDQENCATYYVDLSEDGVLGDWKVVKESTGLDAVQYTGIVSYPEGVFFGSDRAPDGVYFWRRTNNKTDDVYIDPYHLTDRLGFPVTWDSSDRTTYRSLVYMRPFRRYAEKDEVTFFTADRDMAVDGQLGSLIVAFKGVKGAETMIDFTDEYLNFRELTSCLGVTASGNVLVGAKDANTNSYHTLRAKAPVWE